MKITKIQTGNPIKAAAQQPVIVKKGYSPFVQDGTWWQYDETVKGYVDTGITAEGKDGQDGRDFRYEDFTAEQLAALKGEKGDPGRDGADGQDGKNGTDGKTPVKGIDYFDGEPGKDGISPTLTISNITGGHRITIADASGSKSFDVKDGTNGKDAVVTRDAIISALGYAPYKPGTQINASVLRGGINSIINTSESVSINPAINGAGFATYRGAKVKLYLDGYDMELLEDAAAKLFDGSSTTYINFARLSDYCSKSHITWSSEKTYPAGAWVLYYDNGGTSGEFAWYKATVENTGIVPLNDETGTWVNSSYSTTGAYKANLDFTGVEVALEIKFPFNIRYENGLSLYWRANSQWFDHIKVEKEQVDGALLTVDDGTSKNASIVNTYYLGAKNGNANQQILRLTMTVDAKKTWIAMTQLAITGLTGGIENVLVSRGGSTMYGALIPYKNRAIHFGSAALRWGTMYGADLDLTGQIKIGSTAVNESQLKKLLALIS